MEFILWIWIYSKTTFITINWFKSKTKLCYRHSKQLLHFFNFKAKLLWIYLQRFFQMTKSFSSWSDSHLRSWGSHRHSHWRRVFTSAIHFTRTRYKPCYGSQIQILLLWNHCITHLWLSFKGILHFFLEI